MATRYQVDIIGMAQQATPPDLASGTVNISQSGWSDFCDKLKGLTGGDQPCGVRVFFVSSDAAEGFQDLFQD